MNSQLQELADLMVDSFDPNEIAFAFASAYLFLAREHGPGHPDRGTYKKVSTQFSRISGHIPTLEHAYPAFYYDNEKQRPCHWSRTHSPYSQRLLHPALVIAYQDRTLQPDIGPVTDNHSVTQ